MFKNLEQIMNFQGGKLRLGLRNLRDTLRYLKHYRDKYRYKCYSGKCDLCGRQSIFALDSSPSPLYFGLNGYRETSRCLFCGASLHIRLFAKEASKKMRGVDLSFYQTSLWLSTHQNLQIYYVGTGYPVGRVLKEITRKGITISNFDRNLPKGYFKNNICNQDLQDLTFADNTFDLVLSEEILEHVRRPELAFKEIMRVLKPGGIHLFTIGCNIRQSAKTNKRVDVSGMKDIFILSPIYHGSGEVNPDYLVYNDFGMDLLDLLAKIGTPTELIVSSENIPGIGNVEVEILSSIKI